MENRLKTTFFTLLVLFIFGCIMLSCTKDKPKEIVTPPPPPPPTSYTHTITINCNIDSVSFIVYDNGTILTSGTSNNQNTAVLVFINTEQTTVVDSITGTKDEYLPYKSVNQSIGATKTLTVTLSQQAADYWLEGSTNADDISGWKDGVKVLSWTGSTDTYQTNTFSYSATTLILDSLVSSGNKKVSIKETDVELLPNGTTKDINLELQPVYILSGKTIDLVSDTTPPYIEINSGIITDEFINPRIQANMSFTIFSKDGLFEQVVTSDGNGDYEVELPSLGDYGIEVSGSGLIPMMYKIIIDSENNEEVIVSVNNTLSIYNFAQSHMGYKPSDADESVLEPTNNDSRTYNWDKQILEGGIQLLFMENVLDFAANETGESINEEMKNLVLNMRYYIDTYENNFYSSKTTEFVQELTNFGNDGTISFAYGINSQFGGLFGQTMKDGVVVSAFIGINKTQYDNYVNHNNQRIKALMLQENASATGAFFELWVQDKPSIWYISMPSDMHTYTEDSKNATNVYHWLSNKLLTENNDDEGFYYPLIDSRICKEFQIQKVKDFINDHSLDDVKDLYIN